MKLLRCYSCFGQYTPEHFGLSKYSPTGKCGSCKKCTSQATRRSTQLKHNFTPSKSTALTEPQRMILHHNPSIINQALQSISNSVDYQCVGFIPHSPDNVYYDIAFTKGDYTDYQMILTAPDGVLYKSFEFPKANLKMIADQLFQLMKIEGLRLEASKTDMELSKITIYQY